ncbi:ELMO domain-containing protein 1-like [Salvelinus sp. IW2-2015]|uniref:ELMO domain-containing protein 1-like n=1 Tax=Salvelinus sp. IW2-2015 TaxID=2691554 RepID=UPI0038D43A4F
MDYRKQGRVHTPIHIDRTTVERVKSFMFICHSCEEEFGMAPQLLRNFYSCTINSILTGCTQDVQLANIPASRLFTVDVETGVLRVLCSIWAMNHSSHSILSPPTRVVTQFFVFLYCKCLWRGLKFVIRKVTGWCELQRICYNIKPGARRTLKIESSLRYSKNELCQSALSAHPDRVEKTIDNILTLKKINPDSNPQLSISLQASLFQIVGYRGLVAEVETLRREPYDFENPDHEEMLMKLWKTLRPDSSLTGRISKQWCEIGFQGNDPKTDFRGMGLLGLHNLLNNVKGHRDNPVQCWFMFPLCFIFLYHRYFAEHDKATALQVLYDSLQPKHRYSFAIVGINITDLAYSLLVSGALKTHLYNVAPEMPSLSHFQQTFCYLMQEFHRFWIEDDPCDIMEFNRVRSKFHRRVLRQLKNPDMALCPHFTASNLHLVNL